MTPRARLIVAAALFVGWLGWLGYTALNKSRAPAVSRAQATGASVAVIADLTATEGGAPAADASVTEVLTANGPAAGKIVVANLPTASGFAGSGRYLLLLTQDGPDGTPLYRLAGPQRSPGADIADTAPPRIYLWTKDTDADLRQQVRKLFP